MIFVLTEKEANIVRLQFATFRNPSKKTIHFNKKRPYRWIRASQNQEIRLIIGFAVGAKE